MVKTGKSKDSYEHNKSQRMKQIFTILTITEKGHGQEKKIPEKKKDNKTEIIAQEYYL